MKKLLVTLFATAAVGLTIMVSIAPAYIVPPQCRGDVCRIGLAAPPPGGHVSHDGTTAAPPGYLLPRNGSASGH